MPWTGWAEESGIVLAELRGDLSPKQNPSRDLMDMGGNEANDWE